MSWRKSWARNNIYGENGDGDCKKRNLFPAERSVLDDYLDLAELSVVRGCVCIAKGIGYTVSQLSSILKTSEQIIVNANKKLVDSGTITIDKDCIYIKNWSRYQSEYARQKKYRGVTTKGDNEKLLPTNTEKTSISISLSLSKNTKSIIYKWNEKMPWKIQSITEGRAKHLRKRLAEPEFDLGKICDLILKSDFLMGKKPSEQYPNFKADFDWVIKNDTNYMKVLEGKYAQELTRRED